MLDYTGFTQKTFLRDAVGIRVGICSILHTGQWVLTLLADIYFHGRWRIAYLTRRHLLIGYLIAFLTSTH